MQPNAGHIGNYDSCLSYSKVTSTWRPLAGTDPFIGNEDEISEDKELKVEVTVTVTGKLFNGLIPARVI